MPPPRRKTNNLKRRCLPWRSCVALLVGVWLACLYAYSHIYAAAQVAVELAPSRAPHGAPAAPAAKLPEKQVAAASSASALSGTLAGAGGLPAASGPLRSLQGAAAGSAVAEASLAEPSKQPSAAVRGSEPPSAPVVPSGGGEAPADAWTKLLASEIQVDYMRERMRDRKTAWSQTLADLSPAWEPLKITEGDGVVRALVWPAAAYQHFGVKRVWSLGEYAQWADLCASLATLGFEVVLWPWHGPKKDYPRQSDYDRVTAVFTDYDGIHGGWRFSVRPPPDKTWILDTFGTDGTVVQHGFFGRQPPLTNYPLGRFLTLVPGFATRNSFLGVAVVAPAKHAAAPRPPKREWRCVLWSKVHPWIGWKTEPWHKTVLQEYTKHCHVVATIDKNDTYKTEALIRECCPEVEIRGVATTEGFSELLRTSAVYLGVGEPLIAPSCFEALSLGTHVVQPRFPKPKVLANKPITQAWSSQHPFLEQVPEPFAYTVDPQSPHEIAEAFRKIKGSFDSVFNEGAAQTSDTKTSMGKFYAHGEYPLRDVYSMSGFLGRVAKVARNTQQLTPNDWAWEREAHPKQLPKRAFEAGGSFG